MTKASAAIMSKVFIVGLLRMRSTQTLLTSVIRLIGVRYFPQNVCHCFAKCVGLNYSEELSITRRPDKRTVLILDENSRPWTDCWSANSNELSAKTRNHVATSQ